MSTTVDLSRRQLLVGSAASSVAMVFGSLGYGVLAASGASRPVNAFVHFEADGGITLINPAIDMGQGSGTALAQVLADALDADWARIRVRAAPYDDAYGNPHFGGRQVTADSAATAAFWPLLRRAGSEARTVLVWNAMQRWQCEARQVRTEAGWLLHDDGRRMAYAELAPVAKLPGLLSQLPTLAPAPSRLVGQPLPRLDLADRLNGSLPFGVDVRSAQALVAVLLPAERLGARLEDAGDAAARVMPGVVDVLALPDRSAVAVVARDTWSALQGRRALRPRWTVPAEAYDSESALQHFAQLARSGVPDAHVVRSIGTRAGATAAPEARRIEALVLSRHVTHAALEPQNAQATPSWLNQGADIAASARDALAVPTMGRERLPPQHFCRARRARRPRRA